MLTRKLRIRQRVYQAINKQTPNQFYTDLDEISQTLVSNGTRRLAGSANVITALTPDASSLQRVRRHTEIHFKTAKQ
jgi:hypothetical protein